MSWLLFSSRVVCVLRHFFVDDHQALQPAEAKRGQHCMVNPNTSSRLEAYSLDRGCLVGHRIQGSRNRMLSEERSC